MRKRVIANNVAALLHLQCDVGPLPNVASDHEKSRMNVVLRENIEQMQRVRIVWSVVKSQRNLLGPSRQATKGPAKPLACRRHGLISGGESGNASSSEDRNEHSWIVN